MSIRKHLGLLIGLFVGALLLVSGVGIGVVTLVRVRIQRLSKETSPMQVKLAKVQRRFERISSNFARIGNAAAETELAGLEGDTAAALADVEKIISGLGAGNEAGSPAEIGSLKDELRLLAGIARERLARRAALDQESESVAREIAATTQATAGLTIAMAGLQKETQEGLLRSKLQSQHANSSIRSLFVLREKAGVVSALVAQGAAVENRYKLTPLRDRAKAALDSMATVEIEGELQAPVRAFAAATEQGYLGESGLLALRAAMLAHPGDARSKQHFEEVARALQLEIEELLVLLAEALDPLELATVKANESMNQATARIEQVSAVAAGAGEITAAARSLSASAWQILVARSPAEVKRVRAEVASALEGAGEVGAGLRGRLTALARQDELAVVDRAAASLASVRRRLLGAGGVAEAVSANLEAEEHAVRLRAVGAEVIETMAARSGVRANAAESTQEDAVDRIEWLSGATAWILGLVGAAAVLVVLIVGERIRRSILAAEENERRSAQDLRGMVAQLGENTASLRTVSRELHGTSKQMEGSAQDTSRSAVEAAQASSRVDVIVGSVAARVREGQDGIRGVARDAQQAARVGEKAMGLVEGARSTVARLGEASREIGSAVALIDRIAEQTNLLALNAMIEAQSAGAAGRGFAVVATEVKELAKATAQVTNEIERRTRAIQAETSGVVQVMGEIGQIIAQVNELQQSIAGAVEQQTASATTISASVVEAAGGCSEIAGNVQRVHAASQGTVRSSEQVLVLAGQLATMADALSALCAHAAAPQAGLSPESVEEDEAGGGARQVQAQPEEGARPAFLAGSSRLAGAAASG